jgi:hypothetical protein
MVVSEGSTMTHKLSSIELAQLGLSNCQFAEEESLEIQAEEAAHGKGLAVGLSLSTLVSMGLNTASFTEISSRLVSDAGVRASLCDQNRFIILFEDSRGRFVRARVLREGEQPYRPAGERDTVALDLSKGPAVVGVEDVRLEVETDERRLDVRQVVSLTRDTVQPVSVRAPLGEWVADCPDSWLAGELRTRAAATDSWSQAVATGLHARLLTPDSSDTTRRIVEATMQGLVHELLRRPRKWASELRQEQRAFLENQALAQADPLFDEIDQLGIRPAIDEPPWREQLRVVCLKRDDLESVRVVLDQGNGSPELEATLDALDRRGFEFIHTLPWVATLEDKRLRRASLADPDAWWAEPAAPEHFVR